MLKEETMCAEAYCRKSLLAWKEEKPGGERLRGVGSLGCEQRGAGNQGTSSDG